MRTVNILIILFSLHMIACSSKQDISIDCTNLEYKSSNLLTQSRIDSLISDFKIESKRRNSRRIKCFTNKTKYGLGEIITLTIQNNSKDSIDYLFPHELRPSFRAGRIEDIQLIDKNLPNILVCKEKAFIGAVSSIAENFHVITISALDYYSSKVFNLNAFTEPLEPNRQFYFEIRLPEIPGYYVIEIERFSHDLEGIGFWGLERYYNTEVIYVGN